MPISIDIRLCNSDEPEDFAAIKTRKRGSHPHENEAKRPKTLENAETTPAKTRETQPAAPVTSEPAEKHAVSVASLRKMILGQRIARSLAGGARSVTGDPYCFGRIISVMRGGESLDDDLYRVSYEDGGKEDLNTLTLFGKFLQVLRYLFFAEQNGLCVSPSLYQTSTYLNHLSLLFYRRNSVVLQGCSKLCRKFQNRPRSSRRSSIQTQPQSSSI